MAGPKRRPRKPTRTRRNPSRSQAAKPKTAAVAQPSSLRDASLAAIAAQRGVKRKPPLLPGKLGTPFTIATKEASTLFQLAFIDAAGAPTGQSNAGQPRGEVVWTDGDSELLVHAGRSRLVLIDGFALAGIPVYTEETGEVEVVVPFATGTPKEPLGLVVATEPEPRGPPALTARYGDPLVAAAWQAMLSVVKELSAASGVDAHLNPLLPAVLSTSGMGLHLTAQARFLFDRSGA